GTSCDHDCTCTPPECDPAVPGVRAHDTGTTHYGRCVAQLVDHQCMMVEIDAGNSDVDFVKKSNWNNLEFRATSVLKQIAVIDTRGLPTSKFQLFNDIKLVVEPRNMPSATAAPISSVDLIRSHIDTVIQNFDAPYLQDISNGFGGGEIGFAFQPQ